MEFSEFLNWEKTCILVKNADGSVSEDYSVAITRHQEDMARQNWLDGEMIRQITLAGLESSC